jgi:CSLREA domain-containing protein
MTPRRFVPAIAGLLAVTLVAMVSSTHGDAPAATFTVTSTGDASDTAPGDGSCVAIGGGCTLRAAVEEATTTATSSLITLPAGTFTLGGQLVVAKGAVTVQGASQASTVIDAGGIDRAFDVHGGTMLRLETLTVTNGNAVEEGGAIRAYDATLSLATVTVSSAGADANGGGIFAAGCAVSIQGSTFQGDAGLAGGAISVMGGDVTITGSTFSNCVATDVGGAVAVFAATSATISACTFINNTSEESGGAVYLAGASGASTYTIADSTFTGNDAYGGTGGGVGTDGLVAPGSDGALVVSGSAFALNHADTRGGAIATAVAFTSTNNTFDSNSAPTDPDVSVPTLAPAGPGESCSDAASCDDGDTCTDDVCSAGACQHSATLGFGAVACRLDAFDAAISSASADDLNTKWRSKLVKVSHKAHGKLQAAVTAEQTGSARKRKKGLKGTIALLKKAGNLVRKGVKKKKVADALGTTLQQLLTAGGDAASALLK